MAGWVDRFAIGGGPPAGPAAARGGGPGTVGGRLAGGPGTGARGGGGGGGEEGVAAGGTPLGREAARLEHALAIAVSEASGSRQNFGTMTKPFHPGHAARCGLHAARLAHKGMMGDPTAIEGPVGFFAMFAFGEARP